VGFSHGWPCVTRPLPQGIWPRCRTLVLAEKAACIFKPAVFLHVQAAAHSFAAFLAVSAEHGGAGACLRLGGPAQRLNNHRLLHLHFP